jgi:lactoylglutathione lyase
VEDAVFQELFPILSTPDLARALGFYRDLMGGTVEYQFPAEGEPAYVSVHIGQSSLGIGKQTEPGNLTNDRVTLWVYADDCDTAIERLRTERVPVVQEPATQPWGERIAIVTDPDGNRVIIAAR